MDRRSSGWACDSSAMRWHNSPMQRPFRDPSRITTMEQTAAAAIGLFEAPGFEQVTVDDIAARGASPNAPCPEEKRKALIRRTGLIRRSIPLRAAARELASRPCRTSVRVFAANSTKRRRPRASTPGQDHLSQSLRRPAPGVLGRSDRPSADVMRESFAAGDRSFSRCRSRPEPSLGHSY